MVNASESVNAWWCSDDDEVGLALSQTVSGLMHEQQGRRSLAEQQLAAYIGCPVEELTKDVLDGVYPLSSPTNQIRRIVDTACAKIFAKQRPKAQITTAGADYRTRLTARQQSKFLLANMYQEQPGYADGWEQTEQIGKDGLIWQAGVLKSYPDLEEGRIAHERCYAFDIFADPLDAEYGAPKNLFHVYRYDKHVLAAKFPKAKDVIMASDHYPTFDWAASRYNRHDQCMVYEGWRLPISKDKPGRHVIAVAEEGTKAAVLIDEKWTRKTFPFAFSRYRRGQYGLWGVSLVDEIVAAQQLLDEVFEDCQENVRAVSGGYLIYKKGTIKNLDELAKTDRLKFIEFEGAPGDQMPQVEMPAPFNPAVFQWLQMLKSQPFDLSGIAETTSHGRKEVGIESGVALRTMNDVQSELFLPQSRAYERLIVQTGRLDLDAANTLVDAGGDIALALPSEGFLSKIDWKTIRFPADQYQVTVQAASSLEDTPAGRKQRMVELAQSGRFPAAIADRMLDSGALDRESATSAFDAQFEYLERVIAEYQAWDSEKDPEAGIRRYPDPLLDMDLAILQLTDAYMEMLKLDAPEDNLRLVRELIEQFDAEIMKRAPKPGPALPGGIGGQAMLPPAGGPPPGMPPMGPPPGPPMN